MKDFINGIFHGLTVKVNGTLLSASAFLLASRASGGHNFVQISDRADKSYSTQVYVKGTFGATRVEEKKVVAITCSEA